MIPENQGVVQMGLSSRVRFARKLLGRGARRLGANAWVLRAEASVWLLTSRRHWHSGHQRGHLLIPTVGSGNIGDQAMLDSFLENVRGPVTVLLAREGSHSFGQRPDVRSVVLPNLFSPHPHRRIIALGVYLKLLREHESLSVVGADIMDGAYSPGEALNRYLLLQVANSCGLETRTLGFSWSGDAGKAVLQAVGRTQPGTRLIVRDPKSLERFRAQLPGTSVRLGADTVFALKAIEPYPTVESWLDEQRRSGSPVVLFNVSGLIAQRQQLLEEYVQILAGLREFGAAVLIVPHVVRVGDDDLDACRRLYEMVPQGDDVRLVGELISPGQVAWLACSSAAVFTGRMHLAVIALREGTPAVVLSTQGKVEGMLSYFDCERMAVSPRPGMAGECLDRLHEALSASSAQLLPAENLQRVTDLAGINFEGLS